MNLSFDEIMEMDWRHIKSTAFYANNIRKVLFDPAQVKFDTQEVTTIWNGILSGSPTNMSPQKFTFKGREERVMFLRFNYARMKTSQAIAKYKAEPKTIAKRKAIYWAKIALETRNVIIVANLGLIISVLKKKFGLTLSETPDNVSMGIAALIRAIERFDVGRGFKFSTYAYRAIMNSVRRGYHDNHKLPNGIPIGNGDGEIVVADKSEHNNIVEHLDELENLRNVLDDNLAGLTNHELIVIKSRFFDDKTLQDVGDRLSLSKERIRQLQNIALDKLRDVMRTGKPVHHIESPSVDSSSIPLFRTSVTQELLLKAS
jgi:RNA polymerase primary sigma factor